MLNSISDIIIGPDLPGASIQFVLNSCIHTRSQWKSLAYVGEDHIDRPKFGLQKSHILKIRKTLFGQHPIGQKLSDFEMMRYLVAASGAIMYDHCDYKYFEDVE